MGKEKHAGIIDRLRAKIDHRPWVPQPEVHQLSDGTTLEIHGMWDLYRTHRAPYIVDDKHVIQGYPMDIIHRREPSGRLRYRKRLEQGFGSIRPATPEDVVQLNQNSEYTGTTLVEFVSPQKVEQK